MPVRTLLLALAFAAHIASAAVLTPEMPLAQPAVRRAPGGQSKPAIATNGRDFFVAWTDHRFGGADVFGSRIDADGRVLDSAGIPLLPTGYDDHIADVVWNGSSYIVAYASSYVGINVADIMSDGKILGGLPIVVPRWINDVRIAWSGSAYLVTWSEPEGVRAQVFDSDMHKVGEEIAFGAGHRPAVASNGSGFLVAWSHGFAVVSTSGVASEPVAFTDRFVDRIAIASNGTSYLLFHAGSPASQVLSVSDRGEILRTIEMGYVTHPSVAWDGVRYVAAWSGIEWENRLYGATFDGAVHMTNGPQRLVLPEVRQMEPAIAAHRDTILLTWVEEGEVRSRAFWPEKFAVEPVWETTIASTGVAHQVPLDAVWAGSALNVVWREGDATEDPRILVGPLGGPITDIGGGTRASIAANGSTVAVAYTSLRPHARVLGGADVELDTTDTTSIDIAADGSEFAILWTGTNHAVFLAKVDATGAVTAPARVVSPSDVLLPHLGLAIEWTGSEYAVVIARITPRRNGRLTYVESDLFLHRFDRSLRPIGEPIFVKNLPFGGHAALATSGRDLLLVTSGSDGTGQVLSAQRLTFEGAPIGGAVELARGRFLQDPRAAWNGSEYLVTAWDSAGVTIWEGTEATTISTGSPTSGVVVAGALLYSNLTHVIADLPQAVARRAVIRYFAAPKLRSARR